MAEPFLPLSASSCGLAPRQPQHATKRRPPSIAERRAPPEKPAPREVPRANKYNAYRGYSSGHTGYAGSAQRLVAGIACYAVLPPCAVLAPVLPDGVFLCTSLGTRPREKGLMHIAVLAERIDHPDAEAFFDLPHFHPLKIRPVVLPCSSSGFHGILQSGEQTADEGRRSDKK